MGAPTGVIAVTALAVSFLLTRNASADSFRRSYLVTYIVSFIGIWIANLIWRVIIYPRYFSPIRHLPAPKGGSLLTGHMRQILTAEPGELWTKWVDEIPNDGLIRYQFGFDWRVMPTTPKALADVLVHKNYEFVKPARFAKGFGRLLGFGILFAEGDEHKHQRKLLGPAFAFRHIKELYPLFWKKAVESAEAMSAEIKERSSADEKASAVVNVRDWASRTALDIIGLAALGRDFDAIQDPQNELNQRYASIFTPTRAQRFFFILSMFIPQPLLHALPLKRNAQYRRAIALVRQVCSASVREKRARLAQGDRRQKDIISVAVESGGFDDDEQLVNQMMTFLAAGHETTAASMQFAMYHLAANPDVQHRLRAEIRAAIPALATPTTITAADIDRLPYLNAVTNEVLRVSPPVPATARVPTHDGSTVAGLPVPRGTQIWIAPWAINRSRKVWGADATAFRPERWLAPGCANTGGASSNYDFLTFLQGPRSCIGKDFAKAEFACLLAAWVGRFEIALEDPGYRLTMSVAVTAKPKDMVVRLRVLEDW